MPDALPRLASSLLCLTLGCAAAPPSMQPGGPEHEAEHPAIEPVQWADLDAAALKRAQDDNRIVLVNVVASWCHWCHVMEEQTYADPEVAALLREHFVTIRVDSDARPDVAERYRAWGWPATAVLSPDARPVLELRGYQPPARFAALLRELVADRDAGTLRHRSVAEPKPPIDEDVAALRSRVTAQLDGYFDPDRGGWGMRQKYPFAAPIEHALLRARVHGQSIWQERALLTLRGQTHLIDPVWGGMYQYSLRGDWHHPHFEKITAIQAGAIESFALAAAVTGDAGWIRPARAVASYMLEMMQDPDGGFFTSQDADLRRDDGTSILGTDYYALSDPQRRAQGVPRIDRNVYADLNGAMIAALVRLHAVTGDDEMLAAAIAAAHRILGHHADPRGGLRHAAEPGSLLYLRDQAAMGRGLLALHRATGERTWLERAEGLAMFIRGELEDAEHGGFFTHTEDSDATGVFAVRRKPLEENGLTVQFFVELHHLLDQDGAATPWLTSARRAVSAVGSAEQVESEGRIVGEYALALEALALPRVDVTVVGDPEDPRTTALHRAALGHPDPRVVLERSTPGERYPDTGSPAVYLCTVSACSTPLRDPASVHAAIDEFVSANL